MRRLSVILGSLAIVIAASNLSYKLGYSEGLSASKLGASQSDDKKEETSHPLGLPKPQRDMLCVDNFRKNLTKDNNIYEVKSINSVSFLYTEEKAPAENPRIYCLVRHTLVEHLGNGLMRSSDDLHAVPFKLTFERYDDEDRGGISYMSPKFESMNYEEWVSSITELENND